MARVAIVEFAILICPVATRFRSTSRLVLAICQYWLSHDWLLALCLLFQDRFMTRFFLYHLLSGRGEFLQTNGNERQSEQCGYLQSHIHRPDSDIPTQLLNANFKSADI